MMMIIITYIYLALINALCAHMMHVNLNMIFYTHVEHSPTKTIYVKYYTKILYIYIYTHTHTHTHTHTAPPPPPPTHTHTYTQYDTLYGVVSNRW